MTDDEQELKNCQMEAKRLGELRQHHAREMLVAERRLAAMLDECDAIEDRIEDVKGITDG